MSVTISRFYDDDTAVRRTVGELEAVGLRRDEMVVTSNAVNLYAGDRTSCATRDRGEWRPDEMVEQAVGACAFADIGYAIVGAAVLLIALGLLVIPGLGAIVAGAIGGWLIQRAVSDDAQGYAEGVRRGGTLLAVHVPEADPAL